MTTSKRHHLRDTQLLLNEAIIEEIAKEKHRLSSMYRAIEDTKASISRVEEKIIKTDIGNDKRAIRWRTRYFSQVRVNEQLEKERNKLNEEVEFNRAKIIDGILHFPSVHDLKDEMSQPEWLRLLRQLEMVKNNLVGELRNVQWRLDQESKTFHQLDDLCRIYRLQISVARADTIKIKQTKTHDERLMEASTFKLPAIPLPPSTKATDNQTEKTRETKAE